MKYLIPVTLPLLAGIHCLLPAGTPDVSPFYLLPLLAWMRIRPGARSLPWAMMLLTVLARVSAGVMRGEYQAGDSRFMTAILLNGLACLGAAGLMLRYGKPAVPAFPGGAPGEGIKPLTAERIHSPAPVRGEDTEWTPSTRPDAVFHSGDSPPSAENGREPEEPDGADPPSPTAQSIRRTEAALLRSEARLQFALEGSNTGVWEWDLVTNRNYYSKVWRTMLGYGPEEIANTQEAWVSITHPEDIPVCEASIQRHLSGEAPVHKAEHRLRAKDGSWRWILTKGKILQRDEEGRPLRMFGTHTDITATKKLTADLSAQKDRLELATEAGKFGIWESNFVTGKLTWDHRMHVLFGVPEKDFTGNEADWVRALHPDDRAAAAEQWRVLLSSPGAKSYDAEFRIIHGVTGEVRHMRATAILLWAADGSPSHAIGLNWDVTEETLASETLRKAKEAAEAGEKARSDFMASISHELRTPMNGVLGMTELLLDSPLSPAQTEMVKVMHRSGETLLGIINDILDFSRIESGRMRISHLPFHLADVLRDTSRLLELQAGRKQISLECRIEPGLEPALLGDAGRLQQILTNLAGNAIKFTHEGRVLVSLKPLRMSDDSIRFRMEVSDTGIGIAARHHADLFSPFKQVDQSSHRKFGGTGLGLAISNQIAEAMGGRIEFESEENEGSTFWLDLTLPLSLVEVSTPLPGTVPGAIPQDSGTGRPFRPLRVLLVEDNEANQQVATLMLEQFGHQVTLAEHGQAALEILGTPGFDLVLMDCLMPVMDGLETTRHIRAGGVAAENQNIPIIALTASGMPGDRERCLEIGMNGYALKPINRRELAQAFRQCGLELAAGPLFFPPSADGRVSSGAGTPSGYPCAGGNERASSAGSGRSRERVDFTDGEDQPPVLAEERLETLRQLWAPDARSMLDICVELILEGAPELMNLLGAAVRTREFACIRNLAHDIAGSCANLGAIRLYKLMAALEAAARSGKEETLEADFERSEIEWEKLRNALLSLAPAEAPGRS